MRNVIIRVCVISLMIILVQPVVFAETIEYAGETAYTNCRANLRQDTSTKTDRVALLPEGTRVVITKTVERNGDTWCYVDVDEPSVRGYILLSLLDVVLKPTINTEEDTTFSEGVVVVDQEYYLTKRDQLLPKPYVEPSFSQDDLAVYRTLTVGDSGEDVRNIKIRLFELGYLTKKTNYDKFTELTTNYIRAFQERNGMTADGIATPELQALLYSSYAVSATDDTTESFPKPDLEILSGRIVDYGSSGCAFQLQLRNNTDKSIDAYSVIAIPYSSYGTLIDLKESFTAQMDLCFSNERYVIKAGKTLSERSKNYYNLLSEEHYIGGLVVTVDFYHTTEGETVLQLSENSIWFGIGKGVKEGANIPEIIPASVMPTDLEKQQERKWMLGVTTSYIPYIYQEYYNTPEGMYVTSVEQNSTAEKIGLKQGDIILAIGEVLTNSEKALIVAKGRTSPDDSTEVLFWRSGKYYKTILAR